MSAGSTNERAFSASLVHEINNPLESLLNLLYILEAEAIFTERGREHLALAREEVGRVSQIAQQALNHFRDTPGPQEADVSSLLGSVLDLYNARLAAHDITVVTRFCRDGRLAVYAGPLRQMFSNLMLNAADAMPKGGRMHLRVAPAQEWKEQRRYGLRVTFADNGCGIAADNLCRIMEPFFSTKGSDGHGMGLPLVKEVVQKHRGVLRVRSRTSPGHSGTVFSVFLPAA